ncbi:E3 ubiquitin-protein ligase listerin [Bombus pyrosoma]|uniref:E3 ubiquitin-protein ligase listerin n=1 Tax=Bombus pyrosoma TaxID=396416 RepID=UPI001CB991E7|nr:E3 ubiquitin-protein ligase listerin [Bombus pyrosoma]
MGKNKQAQRTKNNVKPSNSSRSAELLGTSIPNFVGFSAVKDGGYVPILPGLALCNTNEVEMNNVDSNFQIVLKKMNKKDSTTKCKALKEFAIMCRDSEMSAVEGMLPFWPRLYCALAIDIEHRVRETVQLAHAAVVKRVGRGIAMYLKQLAGAWFTSQYDTYPPAASAASNSFNDTFPPKKVVDAIVHCQHEILTYICDNITVHSAQTLSIQKNLTTEEMELKYQSVLISSLYGYSVYLKKVPIQKIEDMIDIHNKIINSNKFWKLAKNDSVPVKTAFFSVLTSMIDNANLLLQNEKKRTVTTIMNNLDETEPALLTAVWESMLSTINKIEDWYTVVNIEKLVLPALWRVLRSGQCCASIVYPNLLPFISQFPKLNVDPHYLYISFFNHMRQGFSVKSVQMSRSEMLAVTTSFVECLRYTVFSNVNNRNLCNALLIEQLIPSLEMCLKENSPMKQIFFCEITHLIRYWSKNRHNDDYKLYSCLIQEFWRNLDILFTSLLNASEKSETFDIPDTNNSQIEFLNILKIAPEQGRKNLQVKFCNPEENVTTQFQIQNVENDTDTEFVAELNKFVSSLCIKYFNHIIRKREKQYVTYLNKLITYFESDELFKNLSDFLKTQINLLNFCNEILQNWLLERSKETEHIIELIFNLMKYMDDSEKNDILKSLIEFDDIITTKSVIQCALSKKHRNDVIVQKWCSQSKISSILIEVAKEIASSNYSSKNQNLILLSFEPLEDGNLLIKEEAVNEIISILCNSFYEIDEMCLLDFTYLICCIVPLACSHKGTTAGAIQILGTLFELRSHNYFSNNSDYYLIDTMRDVWTKELLKTIRELSQSEFINLVKMFATSMWKKIYNRNEEYDKQILVDIAVDFLETILDSGIFYAEEIILTFLTDSDIITWIAETTGIIIYGEVITGELHVSSLDQNIQIHQKCMSIDLTSNTITDNTESCLKWALFNINLLNNLCLRSISKCKSEESSTEELLIHNLNLPGATNLLINVIYSIILGEIYSKHYKSTKCYDNVNKTLVTVQDSFKQLQIYINEDTFNEIRDYITMNFSKYGSMLSYIIYFCCTELCPTKEPKELFECYKSNDIFSLNGEIMLQRLQILSKFESLDNILYTWKTDDNVSELILTRTMLIKEEDISKYCRIVENNPSLPDDCEISEISWDKLNIPLELIRLSTELVKKIPSKLTYKHWNFILISIVLWPLSVSNSKQNINNFKVSTMIVAICQLYHAVQDLINKHEQEKIKVMSPKILDEWRNAFVGDAQSGIVQCWMLYADSYNEKTTALKPVLLLDHLGKAIKMVDGNVIFKSYIPLTTTVELALKLLQSPIASIQLGAYHILKHAVPELVQQDKDTAELENFDINSLNIKKMEKVLQNTQNIVNIILMDFKLCDTVSCTIQPYTDSYTYTVGYLLSWAIILEMCANAHGDLLYQYAEILKDNFFPNLLNNIFRLMPVEVLQDNKNKGAKLMEIFSTEPSLDFFESWTEWRLDHIVCWLYTNSLRHLPVLVRQWWSTADSRVSAAVDKITTHYVSPMLCQEELLNNKLQSIENMQVKVHPTFREVVALYQMDDTKLELNIVLSPNHPLGPVTVEPGQHAGGTVNWRNCHMQLSIFLTHQNGSVWDGLTLWKRNLDKKFAGVEECCICFSIFHINTYQIPKLSCHTCRKKFHTACLYKWFSTSQKPTCPICRNIF